MRVILVRHAEAEPDNEGGDPARRLTPLGVRQAAALGAALGRAGVSADIILTSPFVRARDTAAALAGLLPDGRAVAEVGRLGSGRADPHTVRRLVNRNAAATVVLVGHNPDFAVAAAWLTGCRAVAFEKAAALAADFPAGKVKHKAGVLAWFVPPEWFLPAEGV